MTVEVVHGQPITVRPSQDGPRAVLGGNTWDLALHGGTRVCFRVFKPNPVHYRYFVDSQVIQPPPAADSGAVKTSIASLAGQALPTVVSGLLTLYNGNLNLINSANNLSLRESNARSFIQQNPQVVSKGATTPSDAAFLDVYLGQLQTLSVEVDSALKADAASEMPEGDGGGTGPHLGYLYAKGVITDLLTHRDKGHFGDAELAATLDAFAADADAKGAAAAGGDREKAPRNKFIVAALKAAGAGLLHTRDELRDAYKAAPDDPVYCKQTGKTEENIVFRIAPQHANTQPKRDTVYLGKKEIATVHVRPYIERNLFEVVPLVGLFHTTDAWNLFEAKDGKIQRDDQLTSRARPGSAVLINAFPLRDDNSINFGFGIAFGYLGQSRAVSDFLVGPLISVNDQLRIGIGYGSSLIQKLNAGVNENDAIPTGKTVSDMTSTASHSGISIVFSYSSTIPIPAPK